MACTSFWVSPNHLFCSVLALMLMKLAPASFASACSRFLSFQIEIEVLMVEIGISHSNLKTCEAASYPMAALPLLTEAVKLQLNGISMSHSPSKPFTEIKAPRGSRPHPASRRTLN